jgi:hypothetical protein
MSQGGEITKKKFLPRGELTMGYDRCWRNEPLSVVNSLLKYDVFGLIGVLEEAISVLTNL